MPGAKTSAQVTKASAENLNLLQAGRGEIAFTLADWQRLANTLGVERGVIVQPSVYGTDNKGNQTGLFAYDVWDPTQGTTAASHLTLPNTTGADTFCSGQIVLPASGAVLLTGGDRTVNGVRNYSINDVNLFDWRSNAL